MLVSALKPAHYSPDPDSAKANERIYDEVKDGHKEKNQQSIQHLDNREGKKCPLNDSIKSRLKLIKS